MYEFIIRIKSWTSRNVYKLSINENVVSFALVGMKLIKLVWNTVRSLVLEKIDFVRGYSEKTESQKVQSINRLNSSNLIVHTNRMERKHCIEGSVKSSKADMRR